jgi:hypothetical protein
MPMVRYLDVLVVLLVALPALALGVPAFGYLVAAAAWLLQRVLQAKCRLWVSTSAKSDDIRRIAGIVFAVFGRSCLLAIAIIVAGVAGHRRDGLTAAVVILGAYSIAFVIRLMSGPATAASR